LFYVKTPDEVYEIIRKTFCGKKPPVVMAPTRDALGRTLAEDIVSDDYVPDFTRSTVDGYAVSARDTFGSSESIPAILTLAGEIRMGENAARPLAADTCLAVPTGGSVPDGADAVVMREQAEDYGDGTIGIVKPAAPGETSYSAAMTPSPAILCCQAGHVLTAHDIGSLAALGVIASPSGKTVVGIVSTGDELIDFSERPAKGRSVTSTRSCSKQSSHWPAASPGAYGIVRDNDDALSRAVPLPYPNATSC
jgi:molybdopterin molybdotransferase